MVIYHVALQAAADYWTRREAHRRAHLERIVALRERGVVIGGGPAPDGATADLVYRLAEAGGVKQAVEEDPYYAGGVWTAYRAAAFERFLEPWRLPPVVTDGSRQVTLVEGRAPDVEMASLALLDARGAGRMAFGGFFAGGGTLALMTSPDAAEAVGWLAETGLWEADSLRGRALLHVL
jgi:uncharacterized protein YciI